VDFRPAQARWGTGLYYELRGDGVGITRTLRYSPAARAGLRGGEEIVTVNGKAVKVMSENEVRSAINGAAPTGLKLGIVADGQSRTVEFKDGPIYWLDGMRQ
jgi:C-terminal processing protease CtpA/Prc